MILKILTVNSFSVGVGRVGAPVVDVASQLTMLSAGFPFGLPAGGDVEVTCWAFLGLPLPPFTGDFDFLARGFSPSDSSEPSSSSSSSSLVLGSARRGFFVAVEFLKRRDCRLPVPYRNEDHENSSTYNSVTHCALTNMRIFWSILRTDHSGHIKVSFIHAVCLHSLIILRSYSGRKFSM